MCDHTEMLKTRFRVAFVVSFNFVLYLTPKHFSEVGCVGW